MHVATALALRKRLIAKITLAATAMGAVVAFLIPNRYTAVAKILPPQQSQSSATAALLSSLANNPMGALAASAGRDFGFKNPNDLYVGILKTRPIADALIRRFELQKVYRDKDMTSARKDLAARSEIVSGKDGLISISVEDTDKTRPAALANAYVEEARNLTKGLALSEASERRIFYEEQLKEAKDELANAEVVFKQAQQKSGIIQVDAQAKALIEGIGALRAHLAAKQVELRALRSYATDQNAEVALVQQEIAGMQHELDRAERQGAGSSGYDFSLKNVPESGLAFVRAFREVKYRETLFELLARQSEGARMDEAREAPLIQVVEPAIDSDRASFPHRTLIIAFSSLFGCLATCLVIIIGVRQTHAQEDPRYTEQRRALRDALLGK
jgi:tyrosine-protein kinase Etk/Wzc